MKKLTVNENLLLLPGALLSVAAESAFDIEVEHGLLWITVENDECDYWLGAGQRMRVPAQRHVVLEAQREHSHVHLLPGASTGPVVAGCLPLHAVLVATN
ncbi:MAG: DUF2917 domain-containing protein [Burkholderiales bacterium]|nr:DUF2917 domain-containing protein [Burkholderiales bacterium]